MIDKCLTFAVFPFSIPTKITEFVKGITMVLPNYGTYTVQDHFITSKQDLLH